MERLPRRSSWRRQPLSPTEPAGPVDVRDTETLLAWAVTSRRTSSADVAPHRRKRLTFPLDIEPGQRPPASDRSCEPQLAGGGASQPLRPTLRVSRTAVSKRTGKVSERRLFDGEPLDGGPPDGGNLRRPVRHRVHVAGQPQRCPAVQVAPFPGRVPSPSRREGPPSGPEMVARSFPFALGIPGVRGLHGGVAVTSEGQGFRATTKPGPGTDPAGPCGPCAPPRGCRRWRRRAAPAPPGCGAGRSTVQTTRTCRGSGTTRTAKQCSS